MRHRIHALGRLDETYGVSFADGEILMALMRKTPAHLTVQAARPSTPHLAVGMWAATMFVLLAGPQKPKHRDMMAAYGVIMPMFSLVG